MCLQLSDACNGLGRQDAVAQVNMHPIPHESRWQINIQIRIKQQPLRVPSKSQLDFHIVLALRVATFGELAQSPNNCLNGAMRMKHELGCVCLCRWNEAVLVASSYHYRPVTACGLTEATQLDPTGPFAKQGLLTSAFIL